MKNFITSKILLYYKFFRCGITHILKCLINHESARLHLSVDNIVYCLCNHVVFQNQLHLELKKMSKGGSNVLMVKVTRFFIQILHSYRKKRDSYCFMFQFGFWTNLSKTDWYFFFLNEVLPEIPWKKEKKKNIKAVCTYTKNLV